MNQVMLRLRDLPKAEYTPLMQTLFGLTPPSSIESEIEEEPPPTSKVVLMDPSLNDSQEDAIRFALASPEVALIHGPPGVSGLTRSRVIQVF